MWKKLKKRKIQRLLKGSFPPLLGGVLFSNAKKEPKRLNRFTLLRSNSFAIGKPTHPSKVYPMLCFFHRFYEAPTKARHWIFGFIDFMFPKGNIPFIKPYLSPKIYKTLGKR